MDRVGSVCVGTVGAAVLVLGLFMAGCDSPAKPLSASKPEPTPIDLSAGLIPISKYVVPTEFLLRRVDPGYRNLTGDLRPYWRVSGRVRNSADFPIHNVKLQVSLQRKGTGDEVDSSTIVLKDEIPANSVVALTRDIQLLPPNGPWQWNCYVVSAERLSN